MKIYLAGPMRGYPNWNFALFDEIRDQLTQAGHHVFSPAEQCRALGYLPDEDSAYPHQEGGREHLKHVMLCDIACIYAADALALLPGWQTSRGATVEVALAQFLGLTIYDAMTMFPLNLNSVPWMNHDARAEV